MAKASLQNVLGAWDSTHLQPSFSIWSFQPCSTVQLDCCSGLTGFPDPAANPDTYIPSQSHHSMIQMCLFSSVVDAVRIFFLLLILLFL